MAKTTKVVYKRKFERRRSDQGTFAEVEMEPSSAQFSPTIHALVIDESDGGCSFICIHNKEVDVNQTVAIKVGKAKPVRGKVMWTREAHHRVYVVGVAYDG